MASPLLMSPVDEVVLRAADAWLRAAERVVAADDRREDDQRQEQAFAEAETPGGVAALEGGEHRRTGLDAV